MMLLIFAAAAQATVTPANPVVGDTITVTGPGAECPNNVGLTYSFTLVLHNADGSSTTTATGGPQASSTFTAQVTQAGNYTATVSASCSGTPNGHQTSDDFTVRPALGGSIAISPDPPVVNQAETITASATGGYPGYTFSFSIDGGAYTTPSATRTLTTTFTSTGQHTVSVKINDNSGRTTTVTHTYTVVSPPPPSTTTTTTTTAPAPCKNSIQFDLSEFTTTGCFALVPNSSPAAYTTTSAVTFNGIHLPDYGQTFTITTPADPSDGGHFSAPNSAMMLDTFTAFSGDIDWALPAGQQGDEKPVRTFAVANGAHFLGLPVLGSIALQIGLNASGVYYADFPLNLELPVAFTAGPGGPEAGSVSGAVSVRVDDQNGVQYNGLKLAAKDVWLGKLKVPSVCFSYIPAGGTTTMPCDKPSFAGDTNGVSALNADSPFITCNTDANTSRWDASAEVELPTSDIALGAFGGLADGRLTSLGASVGNLGQRVPLADGVYLDHVSFGVCLSPPPFQLKADVGANFLGSNNTVAVDGTVTYTDGFNFNPWSLQLAGKVSVADIPIGYGTFGVNGFGVFNFSLGAGVDVLSGAATLKADIDGWIDGRNGNFVVSGEGQICLQGLSCPLLKAEGEVSTVGVAGCVTIGSFSSGIDLVIPLDGGAPHLGGPTEPITAGFGYDWNASTFQLLGGSCDFTSYEPTYPVASGARAGQASAGYRVRIAPATKAVALRIHGTHGPPRVVLHGPHGTTITQPTNGGVLRKGHYVIAENKTNGTTNVLLVRPAAGVWTVSRAPGSVSSPTKVDRASAALPPTFATHMRRQRGLRSLQVAYAVPTGTTVRLLERSKGLTRTLVTRLGGHRCPGLPRLRPGTDEKILCLTMRFRPADGPGGVRHIQAVVTRRGIPIAQENIAAYRVARPAVPSRVGTLRVLRGTSNLTLAFSPSRGASRYTVSAMFSDGRRLAFDLGNRCRALRIPHVPAGDAAAFRIAGVRYDLVSGRESTLSIKANARSAGRASKKLRLGKVCT